MSDEKKYVRWVVTEIDLKNMTPKKARDLIVECFFEAQKETLARTKQIIGAASNDEEIRKTVVGIIKAAFHRMGCDFDNPTPATLIALVESLAKMSQGWGTPQDIIEHHKGQIMKVLGKLQG